MMVSHRIWVAIISLGWVVFLAPVFWPSWYWFRIDKVFVHDTVEGSTPLMEVEREIVHPFQAKWVATVMRSGSRGFYSYCTARGIDDYEPDSMLPDIVDLNWWTWPVQCKLPAGTYRLHTLWVIRVPFFPEKEVRIRSNVFEISAR